MNRSWIVARKEILDTVRDGRTLLLAFVLPLLMYPCIFIAVGQVMQTNQAREAEAELRVAIAGAEHAPGLPAILAQAKQVRVLPVELGPAAVRQQVVEVVVAVPPGHEAAVLAGVPSTIDLYYDQTDALSRRARERVEEALVRYREHLLREKLSGLGADSGLVDAPRVETKNVASAQQMGAYVLGTLVPYLLVILISSAASHTAIDTTAGEKERSTLETILVSAATRQELLVGKFLATFAAAAFAGIMGLIGLTLTLSLPVAAQAFASTEGRIVLPAWSIGVLLLMILPVAAILSAILLVFGCFARSAREGQTFASYFIMLVAVIAVLSVTSEVKPTREVFLIPILGTTQVQRMILSGSAVPGDVFLAIASTVFVAALGVWVALRLFANERVMFRQ